jgi:iron complex transport system ATP-binding protein
MVMDLLRGLKNRGLSAFLSLHDLRLARRYADRVILLHRGAIAAAGKPEEALKPGTLQAVFEIPPDML